MSFSIKVTPEPKQVFKSIDVIDNLKAFENLENLRKLNIPGEFQYLDKEDFKVFVKNWSPILTFVKNQYQMRPMRYGLVPRSSDSYKTSKNQVLSLDIEKEKINFYLQKNLRGLICLQSYFLMLNQGMTFNIKELTPIEGINTICPVIYDNWFSKDKNIIIQSFSLITRKNNDGLDLPLSIPLEQTQTWLEREPSCEYLIKLNPAFS